jgi:hypothetical protein
MMAGFSESLELHGILESIINAVGCLLLNSLFHIKVI